MNDIYGEIITERSEYPENRRKISNADVVLDGVNASCGDKIKLFVKIEGEKIAELSFLADACALSAASADVMADFLQGIATLEAKRITEDFLKCLKGAEQVFRNEEIAALLKAGENFARQKCIALPWETLLRALD